MIEFNRWHPEASTRQFCSATWARTRKPSSRQAAPPGPASRWRPAAAGKTSKRATGRKKRTGTTYVLWRSENLANYLLKGKQVYVEGRISNRSYEDKDGNKKYFTEIVADDVILLGGRGEGGGARRRRVRPAGSMPRSAPRGPQPTASLSAEESSFDPGITDDDVPF